MTFYRTDYELANCFEAELFLLGHGTGPEFDMPIPSAYAEGLRSPLLAYSTTFIQDRDILGIDATTAEILEDVRFLTISITSNTPGRKDVGKIRGTATCKSFVMLKAMMANGRSRAHQPSHIPPHPHHNPHHQFPPHNPRRRAPHSTNLLDLNQYSHPHIRSIHSWPAPATPVLHSLCGTRTVEIYTWHISLDLACCSPERREQGWEWEGE